MQIDSENLAASVKSALRIEDEFGNDGITLIPAGRDFKCLCPFHAENSASCVIHPDEQYFKCHGCGAGGDVLDFIAMRKGFQKSGKDFIEVLRLAHARANIEFPESNPKHPPKPRPVYTLEKLRACCEFQARENAEVISQWNEYTNPETRAVEAITVRFDKNGKKRLLQATPNGDGFSFGLQGDDRKQPIWNRTRLKSAEIVVIVEGETKVRLLTKLEIVATCNLGGSKAAKRADWSPLAGKQVVIWRDNDDAGLGWQNEIIEELAAMQIEAGIVDISKTAVKKGDDVVDYYKQLAVPEEEKAIAILDVLSGSIPETLESQIRADMCGKRFAIRHESFYALSSTLFLLPGSITMLCASPGVSKSFLLIQWIWQMCEAGYDSCVIELESGLVFHERRVMAQLAQRSDFLNPEFCAKNPENSEAILRNYGPTVREYIARGVLQYVPTATVDGLISIIEKEAQRGRKVIAIDPITMIEVLDEQKSWLEQKQFVRRVKKLVWKYQIRLILVTHPRKGTDKIHPDNMAGSVAFQQNTDTIIWLEAHPTLEKAETTGMGFERRPYNRTAHLQKTRLGPAKKPTIGYFFDGGTLLHDEVGFLDG